MIMMTYDYDHYDYDYDDDYNNLMTMPTMMTLILMKGCNCCRGGSTWYNSWFWSWFCFDLDWHKPWKDFKHAVGVLIFLFFV